MKNAIALTLVAAAMIGCSKAPTKPKLVEVPDLEPCKRGFVSVHLDTYQECLLEGMTYEQVANIIGFKGTPGASSGSSEIWHWRGRDNEIITVLFDKTGLSSKSQVNLKNYSP